MEENEVSGVYPGFQIEVLDNASGNVAVRLCGVNGSQFLKFGFEKFAQGCTAISENNDKLFRFDFFTRSSVCPLFGANCSRQPRI